MSTSPETEKESVAMSSVLAGSLLTGMKLVVGVMTGSLGILSEAAHSTLDLVAAFVTFLAVRVSGKPADEEHQYGHGKVENLSALIETILLLVTCGWIVVEVCKRLFFREVPVEATVWAFAVMAASIVIDASRSRALRRAAVKYGSQALEADALNFSTDIWSSLVVLFGLGAVKIAQTTPGLGWLHRADSIAALLVAVIVVGVSLRLGRRAVDVLLDRAPSGVAEEIGRAVLSVEGAIDYHKVRLRSAGSQTFIDLHVDVDRNLPFERSHAISEEVEHRVEGLIPNANALVHIDPVEDKDEGMVDRIRNIALNLQMTVHNVRVHQEKKGVFVDMHLEVDDRMSLEEAHSMASRLEREVREDQPRIFSISTHIESRRSGVEPVENLTPRMEEIVGRVREIVDETMGLPDCHNIEVRGLNGYTGLGSTPNQNGLVVSLHCYFDRGLSIGEVHRRSDVIEERVIEGIPGVDRVSVHAEPRKISHVTGDGGAGGLSRPKLLDDGSER